MTSPTLQRRGGSDAAGRRAARSDGCVAAADLAEVAQHRSGGPRDFKTWEVHSEPERRDPDPLFVDEFVAKSG